MRRENPLKTVPIGTVLMTAAMMLLVGLGVPPVGAETDDRIYVERPGSPVNLVPGDTNHTIYDIRVNNSGDGIDREYIQMSIDLSRVEAHGVDVSAASVDSTVIQDGIFKNQSKFETTDGSTVLSVVVEYTGSGEPVQVDEITIGGINSKSASAGSDIQHPIYVTESNTQSVDTTIVDTDEAALSDTFNIAGGSFHFQKQATGSSDSYIDGFTILSATVENVQANVDSTLVIAFEDDFTRIAGLKPVSSGDLNGDNQISIRYVESGGFPGPHTVYLIPESRLSSKDYDPGDELPKSASDAALATKTAESVFSLIRFDDINTTSVVNDQITVSTAALYDEQGGKTPFILTVHPLQSDGKIIRDQYLGVSDVLSGRNDDVEIQLKDLNGAEVSLAQSNRYGVVMRLVDQEYQVGDSVSPGSSTMLQNSDLNRQFVENGVSDIALISIHKSDTEKATAVDSFNSTADYDNEVRTCLPRGRNSRHSLSS